MIVDQSDWGLIELTGQDRIRFVNGMCTANIETLAEGEWIRASMCNVKGRIVSVYDVVNRGDSLLLITEPQLAASTVETLETYAIADDVDIRRAKLDVFRVWDSPRAVWEAPPLFQNPGGEVASSEQVERRRIEGGFPKYGIDITDKNFPFETPLAKLIDYEKGCYIGQEPIARVEHRGAPQKMLRGLAVSGDEKPPIGARVAHPDRDRAGEVTSSTVSPDLGAIALAFVHRTASDPGTAVSVADRPAKVVELPFSASIVAS